MIRYLIGLPTNSRHELKRRGRKENAKFTGKIIYPVHSSSLLDEASVTFINGIQILVINYSLMVRFYFQLIKKLGENYGMVDTTSSLDRPGNPYCS